VDDICGNIDAAIGEALDERTLRDLALANPPVGNDGAAPAHSATGLVSVVPAIQPSTADAGGERAESPPGTGQERV
jgi:hypothetical protein